MPQAAIREQVERRFEDVEILKATDIAETILYIVTRPRHMAIKRAAGPAERIGRLTAGPLPLAAPRADERSRTVSAPWSD